VTVKEAVLKQTQQEDENHCRKQMLTLAALGLLQQEPMNGYRLKQQLEIFMSCCISVNYGAIYPLLKRLEEQGEVVLIDADAENISQSCKTYGITKLGQERWREEMLDHASSGLRIPANALVVRSEGTQVAVVGQGQKVHYQNVTIGRDYGTEIEIASGLVGNEQLIVNPTDDIREGTSVRAVATR
jgi:DNA-binding PadR family transcriptional regulator